MKTKILIILSIIGTVSVLTVAGNAGAVLPPPTDQTTIQTWMDPVSIPQFVEPLPLLEFEFINATSGPLPGVLAGYPALGIENPTAVPPVESIPFPIDAYEFQSQILPSPVLVPPVPGWPPATCGGVTASYTFGYVSDDTRVPGIHDTYLGPVVIAERGITSRPIYGNRLPLNGNVQSNLPIDQTLDWAIGPINGTGPIGCGNPDGASDYTNPFCGEYPYVGPMPIATHLHGGEVPPAFDGGPDAWFTQLYGIIGPGWPGPQYEYPNNQQESLIWFHDHALGITRLNVFAGLAGIHPIIDPLNSPDALGTTLPNIGDGFHVPLIIQDRSFDTNCEIMYNLASNPMPNPTVHPFWIPEFIGDAIVVNGKTWPYFNVESRQYRFSFVNGSNARFYELTIKSADDPVAGYVGAKIPMLVIATDDGYLQSAVSTTMLVIGPGERYEVVVDFKVDEMGIPVPIGNMPIMWNSARTPYPGGGAVVKGLTDRVMQFRVGAASAVADTAVMAGSQLRDPIANPIQPIINAYDPLTGSIKRQLTLNESASALGPLELVVNNSKFNLELNTPGCDAPMCRETEIPAVGDTEIWEIINISADAHPMHTHLTSFQVLSRQRFKAAKYMTAYLGAFVGTGKGDGDGPPNEYIVPNADGAIGGNPAIGPYLVGKQKGPEPYEMGWKDTVIAYPGEVTRIVVRWAPTDIPPNPADFGTNYYDDFPNGGFDPTVSAGFGNVGYVWHCHIVDHEDNEMMRNYVVGTIRQTAL